NGSGWKRSALHPAEVKCIQRNLHCKQAKQERGIPIFEKNKFSQQDIDMSAHNYLQDDLPNGCAGMLLAIFLLAARLLADHILRNPAEYPVQIFRQARKIF